MLESLIVIFQLFPSLTLLNPYTTLITFGQFCLGLLFPNMNRLIWHHENQCRGHGQGGTAAAASSSSSSSSLFKCFCDVMSSSRHSYLQHYNMKQPQATQRHASSRVEELHRLGLGPSSVKAAALACYYHSKTASSCRSW